MLFAEAYVEATEDGCALSGASFVGDSVILGWGHELIDHHKEIHVPLVGTLHLSETIIDGNTLTQRAIWLETHLDPLLDDIVISEAIVSIPGGAEACLPEEPPPGDDDDATGDDDDAAPEDSGWMTGGGKFDSNQDKSSHGFRLDCDPGGNHNLEVNWGKGNKFHLESLSSASCSDSPGVDPEQPAAANDTHTGSGAGRYNGQSGAFAWWTFTDDGQPSKDADGVDLVIEDAAGNVVLDTGGTTTINTGNQQAH